MGANAELKMLDRLLDRYGRLVFFDLETTGLSATDDRVLEFGSTTVTRDADGHIAAENTEFLIRHADPIPSFIAEITGLTDDILNEKGMEREEGERRIVEHVLSSPALVVAYNAHFDMSFVYAILRRFGEESRLSAAHYLDVLTIYRDRVRDHHSLISAAQHFGIEMKVTHHAASDAATVVSVLCAMIEENDDVENYIDLFGIPAKYATKTDELPGITYKLQEDGGERRLYEL